MVNFRSHYKEKTTFAALFYSLSLIHCSHFTYLTHLDTAYQSSQFEFQHLSLSSLLRFCLCLVYQHRFHVHFLLTRHLPCGRSTSCPTHNLEGTINKPFIGLVGLRHVTASRAVTHQSWVARCSPRVPVFSRSI